MTNPNNIVRVRARNGGRASVYEANAWAQGFSMGILEGYGVAQNTSADMNVLVGGSATKPDVLIAQNPAGYKIALDIIGRQAVAITAPASNSRISAIVAYTNDLSLSTTQDDVTGSPASCGLIVVNGTAAANPVAPTDSQIRTAITSDGATGSQAAYCVIATIKVASNTTMITNSLISTNQAAIGAKNIDFTSLVNYIETTDSVTINNVGAYNYKIIPGSSIVLNVKAGEEYLLLGNACVKPSATNETYLLVTANSALVTRGVLNSNVMASGWTNLTNIKRYTATNTGSVTFSLFSGTGGSADTSVDVLNGASLTVIKIA